MKLLPAKNVWILLLMSSNILILNTLALHGQSLKLRNATIQETVSSKTSVTTNSIFIVFTLKGKAENVKPDSLCFAQDCFLFLNADTSEVKYHFVRGKKSTILEIDILSEKKILHQVSTTDSVETNEITDWLYYHAGQKSKKVTISSLHQLPAKTE